jgi:hypothetical protein
MRKILASVFGISLACYCTGCTVHTSGVGLSVETPSVEVDTPVIEGAGVFAIDVEPPPAERVYVYDEGFPPGVYLYDNFYYYNGYRYDHDVFVNRFVKANIANRRYVNVEENRRLGGQIEEKQKADFQKTGGKHPAKEARPGDKPAEHRAVEHPENPAQRTERPAEHPEKPAPRSEKPAEHPEKPADHANPPQRHENVTDHQAKPEEKPKGVKPEKATRPPEKQPSENKEDKKDEK